MIKVLNFLVKVIALFLIFLIAILGVVIALLLWDKKFIKDREYIDLLFKKPKI